MYSYVETSSLFHPTMLASHRSVLDKGEPGVSVRRSLIYFLLQSAFWVASPQPTRHICDIQAVLLTIELEADAFA
jgi:hypothetical protein